MFSEMRNIVNYYVELSSEKTQAVVNNTLTYYVRSAVLYKCVFISSSVILLAINCSIPFINQLSPPNVSLWITLLSSAAAFIGGVLTMISMREQWFRYRTSAETLKSECNMFNSMAGKYAIQDKVQREGLFIKSFETINGKEVKQWEHDLNKHDDKKDDDEDKDDK